MNKPCTLFEMEDISKAVEHLRYKVIRDYGWEAYGHPLHTWDDGNRMLARCENCGGLLLIQRSEYHGMEDDDYYTDYFPVASKEEADELNKKYDGFNIERQFEGKYLLRTNLYYHWSKQSSSDS